MYNPSLALGSLVEAPIHRQKRRTGRRTRHSSPGGSPEMSIFVDTPPCFRAILRGERSVRGNVYVEGDQRRADFCISG